VFCRACGNENPDEFQFCIECGARVEPSPTPQWQQPAPPPRPAFQQPAYEAPAYQQPVAQPMPVAAAPPSEVRVVVVDPLGKTTTHSLRLGATTVGRSAECDIVVSDTKVSRRHAQFVRTAEGVAIEDLASRNGTRVDDRPVAGTVRLQDRATVRLGDCRLTIEGIGAPQSPAAQPVGESGEPIPVVFAVSWSPLQCPRCHGVSTLRPILYGPAAQTPEALGAAQRGEAFLGGPSARSDGPNAQCSACQQRVRIIPAAGA
jgi:hypothetical protein